MKHIVWISAIIISAMIGFYCGTVSRLGPFDNSMDKAISDAFESSALELDAADSKTSFCGFSKGYALSFLQLYRPPFPEEREDGAKIRFFFTREHLARRYEKENRFEEAIFIRNFFPSNTRYASDNSDGSNFGSLTNRADVIREIQKILDSSDKRKNDSLKKRKEMSPKRP